MTATLEGTDSAPAQADGAMGAVPSFDVTLRVRRYTPETRGDEAYWQEFTVSAHGTDRLLDALQ